MKTKIFKIASVKDSEDICEIGKILKNGGIAAIPTETVYGLAANAFDEDAVLKIFRAKGRPQDNPLIVHIADFDDIYELVSELPPQAKLLAEKFWPGPLTMIMPRSEKIPKSVSAGLDTVAIRMPSHPIARAIIRAASVPLAAPSANTSGKPSPTTAQHVIDDLDGKADAVADGGECSVGVESTVITLCTEPPRLLRPGGITPAEIERVIGKIEIDDAVLGKLRDGAVAASPGMKYKHYSPNANVIILRGGLDGFIKYISERASDDVAAICFDREGELLPVKSICFGSRENPAEQARLLFGALRRTDDMGAKTVYVHCPSGDGVGLAVMNRLLRAAEFEVIDI